MFPVLNAPTKKFQVGTRIRSKSTGHAGVITGTSFNSIYGIAEFYVKWDHHSTTGCYSEHDAYHEWEVESPAPTPEFGTFGYNEISSGMEKSPTGNWQKYCDHKWLTYHGLKETFEFCTVCDEKKVK